MQPILSKDTHYFPFHQMFGGFSRHFFRHVSISKSDEARAKQQARLIAMPSRGCYFFSITILTPWASVGSRVT